MVFKRRDPRPLWRVLLEVLWPRGGWGRAAQYVKHRLRRLPDSPHKISRGILAGVFASFTPFYGFHFVIAALVARGLQGNILAALLATFFGNPLTYVPIGIAALETGYFLLGREGHPGFDAGLVDKFSGAAKDLYHNLRALVGGGPQDWTQLAVFWDDVFFPYMVGGVIPGLVAGVICYQIALPLISAYQKRRKMRLRDRLAALKAAALKRKAGREKSDD